MKYQKILSVIERYYENSWLDYRCSGRYTALARCSAGLALSADYYLGHLEPVRATDCSKIKVDGRGSFRDSEKALCHLQRYKAAINSIPREFWPVVRLVCIENKPVAANDNRDEISARRRAELNFSAKVDLCRGLDRLIDFYESYKHPDCDPA